MYIFKQPTRQSIEITKELYNDNFDKFIKNFYFLFSDIFRNKLIKDQIIRFNPIFIDSKRVVSDCISLGQIVIINFEKDMILAQSDVAITFNGYKTFNLSPIFRIKLCENVWDHEVYLESISYPVIDQSY